MPVIPKTIIYPLHFLRSWFHQNQSADNRFRVSFGRQLGEDVETIPLGRARAGIYLLIKHIVTSRRRRVIVSPYTIPDVVNMIKFAGGEPVFVDCLPKSTNIDIAQLSKLIDEETAAVIVTHYHVNQDKIDQIFQICHERDIAFYDDCALSIGAQVGNISIGRVTDASIFSFSGFKTLNFFWGGAITTQSTSLARALCAEVDRWPRLRPAQYATQMLKIIIISLATSRLTYPLIVFPLLSRSIRDGQINEILPMSRIESTYLESTIATRPSLAALGEWTRKLGSIDQIVTHRRLIGAIYDRYFESISVSRESSVITKAGSSYVNYPIVVDEKQRNRIYKEILSKKFDVGLSLYPNVHEVEGFTDIHGYSHNISRLVRSIITLPTHLRVNSEYARALAECVRGIV